MIFFDFNDKIILEKEKVPAREKEDNEYDIEDEEEKDDTEDEEDLEADDDTDEELDPPVVPNDNDIGGETDYMSDTEDDPDYNADVADDDTEGEDDVDDDTDNQDDDIDDTGDDNTTDDEGDTPEDDNEGDDTTDDGGEIPEDDNEEETDYTDDVEDDDADTDTGDEGDTTDDTDDTGEEDEEEDELASLEKNIYSGLSQTDMKSRTNELKNNFLDLYKNVVLIQERLQKIAKSTINAQVIDFIGRKTLEIKDILYDYLMDTFNTNSYTENEKNYLTYIALFDNINKLFEQIYPNTDANK